MEKAFYIYGAGIVATSIYTAIRKLYYCTPVAFLVSSMEGNPCSIDGIPVQPVSEMDGKMASYKCLIATPESHHSAIAESLLKVGIAEEQLLFVDNQLENELMDKYYSTLSNFVTASEVLEGKSGVASVEWENIVVAQAKCHVDRPLNNKVYVPEYVKPIQVGAALTDNVIAAIRDNQGDNISAKNRNYCELTASYYLWKNRMAEYKGLCHYRRVFDVSEEQLRILLSGHEDVDVILPYPSIHYPDICGQHGRYVNKSDWDAMLQALKEVAADYYEAYITDISKQKYFYNYNMLIAKRKVFDDYSNFLFSVLERTEELTTPKGWERADRFAGYLGENLTTIYFMKNRDNLKTVHVGKLWLT